MVLTQPHGAYESLVFDRPPCEVWADKGGLGDHTLPALLVRLLAGVDNLEHLLLGYSPDLGQGHGETRSFLRSLVLNGRTDSLCGRRVVSIKQVCGHRVGRVVVGGGSLYVALLVGLDLLAHLDLLLVSLLGVHLRAQTAQVLSLFGGIVALTSGLLARTLFVVETAFGGGGLVIGSSTDKGAGY